MVGTALSRLCQPHTLCDPRSAEIGSVPSSPARPISAYNTAKTQFIRQPQRNRCLLRSIAYHRHHRPAAWIDPVVLGAIAITWNYIRIPVGRRPYDRHPDEGPLTRLANHLIGLGMRHGAESFQAAQDQGRPQSCNRYPHASISFQPLLSRNSDVPGMFKFVPLLGAYRTSNPPQPQHLICGDGHPEMGRTKKWWARRLRSFVHESVDATSSARSSTAHPCSSADVRAGLPRWVRCPSRDDPA
jgi:hypothetical protein